jgi:ADP-heptose:LPS heptosyltransferase
MGHLALNRPDGTERLAMSLKNALAAAILTPLLAAERLLRGKQFHVPPEAARSILVLEYMLPLGCCVHLTPLYEAIRAARPDATITVATRGLALALLRHHPAIDHLIETPDPLREIGAAAKVLARELRRFGVAPECVLTGVADQRTRIALLGVLAGGGWRAGFTQAPALYRHAFTADRERSHIANNLRLAALLGCDGGHRDPRVYFSPTDRASAEGMVREANPENRPLLVMVTQTSGGQRTGWHLERFVSVIRHVAGALGMAVVYVGTRADAEPIDEIRLAAGGIGVSLAGRTSVTELAALLAMSDFAVSLDTGTMHVARAVGVPMVVLGPSWQRPVEWMPLGIPNISILRGDDRVGAPEGYQLDEIEAEAVIASLAELVREYPASAQSREARVARSLSEVDHLTPR